MSALNGKAFVTEVTANGDGLTEAVSEPHILLIMVRSQRLRKTAGNTFFRGAPRPGLKPRVYQARGSAGRCAGAETPAS